MTTRRGKFFEIADAVRRKREGMQKRPSEGAKPSKTYQPITLSTKTACTPVNRSEAAEPESRRKEYIANREFLISAGRIEDQDRNPFLALAEEARCGKEARRLLRALFIWEQGRKLKAARGLPTDEKPFTFEVTEHMEGQQ